MWGDNIYTTAQIKMRACPGDVLCNAWDTEPLMQPSPKILALVSIKPMHCLSPSVPESWSLPGDEGSGWAGCPILFSFSENCSCPMFRFHSNSQGLLIMPPDGSVNPSVSATVSVSWENSKKWSTQNTALRAKRKCL